MQISRRFLKDTNVFNLFGNFDFNAKQEFDLAVERAQEVKCSHIIIDLAQVPWIDSSGLGRLFLSFYQLQKKGIRFSIVRPSEQVRELLDMVEIQRLIPVYNSESEALAHS